MAQHNEAKKRADKGKGKLKATEEPQKGKDDKIVNGQKNGDAEDGW